MRRRLIMLVAMVTAAFAAVLPAHAQLEKNKLAADPPILRVSPGYDYMAGNPNGTSVEVKDGEGIWLVYYHGKPGDYAGDPKGAPTGKRPIQVESSFSPNFVKILGSAVLTPNAKGHIKVVTGGPPMLLNGSPGRTLTYYVRVRSNLGYSNVVTVNVKRPSNF